MVSERTLSHLYQKEGLPDDYIISASKGFNYFNHTEFNLRKLKKAYTSWQNGLEGKGWNILAAFDMNSAELVLCNYENVDATVMKPYEARVYCWEK